MLEWVAVLVQLLCSSVDSKFCNVCLLLVGMGQACSCLPICIQWLFSPNTSRLEHVCSSWSWLASFNSDFSQTLCVSKWWQPPCAAFPLFMPFICMYLYHVCMEWSSLWLWLFSLVTIPPTMSSSPSFLRLAAAALRYVAACDMAAIYHSFCLCMFGISSVSPTCLPLLCRWWVVGGKH